MTTNEKYLVSGASDLLINIINPDTFEIMH